jgi:sulfate-transporting ATPase
MSEFIQFALLGLGLAAVYTLIAQGVVLIYRGSGVVNFAQGTFAMAGAYVYFELHSRGYGFAVAALGAIATGAVFGLGMQTFVMRPLRTASSLTRVMATLGVFIAIQAGAAIRYGDSIHSVPPFLSHSRIDLGSFSIQVDRIELYGIAVALTLALASFKRWSLTGLATSAAAQNERAAMCLGWSPNSLAALNWTIGGAVAGFAGVLIAPITGLLVLNLSLLIVPALAAALLGRFDSFGLTLLGATGIGAAQSLSVRYVTQTGAGDAIPFLVIIAILVITGRSLPLRSHLNEKLPQISSGRIKPVWLIGSAVLLGFLFTEVFSRPYTDAFTVSLGVAIVLLSLVVVTGYAGQISLAQFALAGLGCYVTAKLVVSEHWPFWLAGIAGIAAAVVFGAIFALPALRTRGVNLAVVTLGLAVVVQRMLFENPDYTGGFNGIIVPPTKLFGLKIDTLTHPVNYGLVNLGALVIALVVVGNLRRSSTGRRLIAIRTNERAAASLGISVVGGKVYAFAVAAGIAALGGILIGFRTPIIVFDSFNALQSVYAVAWAVIGGLGFLLGPLSGSTLAPGGAGSLFNQLLQGIDRWLLLIGGIFVVVILLANPDGLIPAHAKQGRWIGRKLNPIIGPIRRRVPRSKAANLAEEIHALAGERERVPPEVLDVRGLTVRYGGVVAVDEVSLTVQPGQIVGLIGPNGAGKTSLIDAVTGFTRPSAGTVMLGGREITRVSAYKRVRAGLARSWQSLELFESSTVLENIQVASDERQWHDNVRALVWAGGAKLTPAAAAALEEFRLVDHLGSRPEDLSYGQRRLLGIARTTALNPSILMLDEPVAGLDEQESKEVGLLVRRLAQEWGFGVLVVEHDMSFVMTVCDHIVVIDFGRMIASGTPEEVQRDPAVIAAYLGEESSETPSSPDEISSPA